MRSEAMQTILAFCLRRAEQEPVTERVKLYRALAIFCGSSEMAATFCRTADELQAADRRCREVAFQVREGSEP